MSKRVLVIDDSETVRQQIRILLTHAGFDVVEACDGNAGIRAIREDAGLSVVLCDIHMPGKSGLELLEELKASGANVRVPIVMLTSEGDPVLVQRAKLAGAKGWVVKPFKAGLLVSAIQKWTA
jgi:two-component system chemotaxis response regulator CheY